MSGNCGSYEGQGLNQRCPVVCNGNAVVAVVAVIITATTGNGSFAQRQRNGTATPNNGMPL